MTVGVAGVGTWTGLAAGKLYGASEPPSRVLGGKLMGEEWGVIAGAMSQNPRADPVSVKRGGGLRRLIRGFEGVVMKGGMSEAGLRRAC